MAGYSGKALVQKLGIKPNARLAVVQPPPGYWDLLGPLPEGVAVQDAAVGQADVIHLFVQDRASLEAAIPKLKRRIVQNGMIWVSWPKKSSRIPTDVDENVVREIALREGLVDTKVCAVDDNWSGLKLVVRLRDRMTERGSK